MKDRIQNIEQLEKEQVKFAILSPPIRDVRYLISNVPFQIPECHFQETRGFVDVRRITKGEENTQSVIFTSTQTLPLLKVPS